MDIINIVAMYSDFYEINYKGEIIITFPMQDKFQVEFIAIVDINAFLLIIVICEYIYQHYLCRITFKFTIWLTRNNSVHYDDDNDFKIFFCVK